MLEAEDPPPRAAIKFYLDEMISPNVATGLRLRGIDVLTVKEAGSLSKRDEEQLDFATREGRVLVTMDDDYLALHSQGVPHAGIAYIAQNRKVGIGELVQRLQLVYEVLEPQELRGSVEFL